MYNGEPRIASATIAVAAIYNKDPDSDFIIIGHSVMDELVAYFKDHAVYSYCTDLVMDGQLKFKGKPIIAYNGQPIKGEEKKSTNNSASYADIKKMVNDMYGNSKYYGGFTNV